MLEVKLIGGGEWWLPWLPILGALIVASAAFVGILISNRTNRRAITAADDREWVRWRREKVFDLAGEILEKSSTCKARLGGCISWSRESCKRQLGEINNLNSELPYAAARLRLITDDLDAHIEEIVLKVFGLIKFVSDNQATAKREMAVDDRTTFNLIEQGEREVEEAQTRFIEEVRRVSFALGPKAA